MEAQMLANLQLFDAWVEVYSPTERIWSLNLRKQMGSHSATMPPLLH